MENIHPKLYTTYFTKIITQMASRSEHYLRRKAKKQQMRRLRLLDRATEGNEGGKNMIKYNAFKNVITNNTRFRLIVKL